MRAFRKHCLPPTAFLLRIGLCVAAAGAFADGKMFVWRNEAADIYQPSQKAVISWDGREEKLLLQTRYEGPAEAMAWLVPVPSEPQVEKGSLDTFQEMSRRTQEPEIVFTRFGDGRAGLKSRPSPVKWQRRIGAYDVVLLSPTESEQVIDWLRANEYGVEEEAVPILKHYVSERWWIVASRIHRDALEPLVQEKLAKGTLHPLEMTFKTDRCVYPMRLTPLVSGPVELLLWIRGGQHFAPATLKSGDWGVGFYGGVSRPGFAPRGKHPRYAEHGVRTVWDHAYDVPWLTYRTEEHITKLRCVLRPEEMVDDIYFEGASYPDYFATDDPNRLGMMATQLGASRNPGATQGLAQYLSTVEIEDKPRIRSAVWALGEIARDHPLSPEAREALMRCVQEGPRYVRMEAYLSLAKAHDEGLGPMLLAWANQLLTDEKWTDGEHFLERHDLDFVTEWLDIYATGQTRTDYVRLVAQEISRHTDAVAAVPDDGLHRQELENTRRWLLGRACVLRDDRLVEPLAKLRQALEEQYADRMARGPVAPVTWTRIAEAACGSESARAGLVQSILSEEALMLTDSMTEGGDVNTLGELTSRDRRPTMRTRILSEWRDEKRHFIAEYVRNTPALQDALAQRALAHDGLTPWYQLYLLCWISDPDAHDFERLSRLWESAVESPDTRATQRLLAVDVAYRWAAADELIRFHRASEDESVKEEALWALASLEAPEAWPVVEEAIRTTWNDALREANVALMWGHMSKKKRESSGVDLGDPRTFEALQGYIAQMARTGQKARELEALATDKAVCPALRLTLLSITPWAIPWAKPHIEALFEEVTVGEVSHDVYVALARMMGQAKSTDMLLDLWEAADEGWKQDALVGGLLWTKDTRVAPVMDKLFREVWHARYQASGDVESTVETSVWFHLLDSGGQRDEWSRASLAVYEGFLSDESFDRVYRAYFAARVPNQFWSDLHPTMKALLTGELPAETRRRLELTVKEAEEILASRQKMARNAK